MDCHGNRNFYFTAVHVGVLHLELLALQVAMISAGSKLAKIVPFISYLLYNVISPLI